MKRLLTYLGVVLLACGCGLDGPALSDVNDSQIELSASKMRIITKSGDEAESFSEGTRFRLFAVQNGTDWSAAGTKFYNVEGVGDTSGNVDYSIDSDGKKASYDVGRNLDFYGVTYGTGSDISVSGSSGSAPHMSVSMTDGKFPDLLYSDNLKNKNSSSGLLQMEFRHTLSKLKFEVLKQNEALDADKKLDKVVLKKVVLRGTTSDAVFDIKTGGWSYSGVQDLMVFEDSEGLQIGTSATPLKNGTEDIEMLVVPNVAEIYLDVTLDLDGDPATDDDKTVEYKLMVSETEFLKLEQNHEYTLSIVVLKNDVRIVTVTPKVYEWVDIDLTQGEAYLGQPVYFGGLMWMDRNLGAKSADCENDWYHSIGYYYQFGRNIPYMLDVEEYLKASDKSFKYTGSDSKTDPDAVFNLKFLYTYDKDGDKVTTVKHANNSSGSCLYENIAITPGDDGDYSYIRGYIYESGGERKLNNKSWAKKDLNLQSGIDNVVDGTFDNHIFWETIENQPCPKGWRLPGKSDMYSFMPESTKLFWLDIYMRGDPLNEALGKRDANGNGKIEDSEEDHKNYAAGSKNAAGELYAWKYFAGKFKVDPKAGKSDDFTYPVSDKSYGRVYGIKYEGESRAYRVMFEQCQSTSGASRKYVRISRYETNASDRFIISDDGTQWNIHKFDWNTPVEYMDIPLAGFLYEDGMSDFGAGAILRAVEGDGDGHNWTMYLRSGHNGVAVAGGSRRNLGDQIRCVRDINAK